VVDYGRPLSPPKGAAAGPLEFVECPVFRWVPRQGNAALPAFVELGDWAHLQYEVEIGDNVRNTREGTQKTPVWGIQRVHKRMSAVYITAEKMLQQVVFETHSSIPTLSWLEVHRGPGRARSIGMPRRGPGAVFPPDPPPLE
jgi:hypothetical protein